MSEVGVPPDSAELPAADPPRRGVLREHLTVLTLAFLLAFAIRSFVAEPFVIPSGSMYPTLLIGDHLFVDKFAYGPRVPFTSWRLPGRREPARGDVVVFTVARRGLETRPADRAPDWPREEFVKRIVGLPGDHIRFRDGMVFVNGDPVRAVPLAESFLDPSGRQLTVIEVAQDDRVYRVLDDPRSSGPYGEDLIVEAGRYFTLGDNRDYSKDSRVWGTVRREEIRGPAVILYWSWEWKGAWRELLSPVRWWELLTTRARWDRFGQKIQ